MMKEWLIKFFPNLRDAAIRWNEDDASSLAASVAYYLALSLFPLVLLLTSGLGLFLEFTRSGKNAEQQLLSTVSIYGSPFIEEQFRDVLKTLRSQSVVTCPSGLLASILAAIGVFCQLDRGFDKVWRIPPRREKTLRGTLRRIVRDRFWAFVMLVGLGAMVAMLFSANMILVQVRSTAGMQLPTLVRILGIFDFVFTTGANSVLFALAYRWLPKRPVRWTEAFRGGLLAASVWELGRVVLGMFFIGMRYTSAYGAIGSFIAILLWCYYGVSIFFFGAEYVQILQQNRTEKERKDSHHRSLDAIDSSKDIPIPLRLAEPSLVTPESQDLPKARQIPRRCAPLRKVA